MKKLISLIIICTLLVSTCGVLCVSANETTESYEMFFESVSKEQEMITKQEEKIYCNATLEDDFEEDSVIVVFKNTKSRNLDNHTTKSFSDVSAKSVKDLTSRTKSKIEKQRSIKTQAKNGLEISTTSTTDELHVDENKFHQIVKIDLGIKSKENVLACIKKLEARDDVLMAFPNYYFKPTSEVIPNDPYFPDDGSDDGQWGSRLIELPNAWNITTGSNTVKVGVLDSGIDNTHVDLTNRYNSALSKDFTGGNAPNTDTKGHGTQVAGIIGAQGNNSYGVAGVCWNVSLVSLKVVKRNNQGEYVANLGLVGEAIDYATDNNIPILNFSCCAENSHDNELAVIWGNYPGLFVCSTTNEREDISNGNFAYYDYNPNNTIVVTATNRDDELLEFRNDNNELKGSSYSATKVHLAAPGDDIWTTKAGGGYIQAYATSMATPFVTGVAALLKSKYPTMDAKAIKDYILSNVDIIPELEDKVVTGGRLNAYKALTNLKKFYVNYNANGGGGTTMTRSTIIYGCATPLRENTYSKAGCAFKGWNAKRDDGKWYYTNGTSSNWYTEGSQPAGYSKYLYRDEQKVARTAANGKTVTMYAKWEKKFNIEFVGNNASSGSIENATLSSGVTWYIPSTGFSRNNCTLEHWYVKNSSGEHYCSNGTSSGWFAIGTKPSGYNRVDFSKGAPLTVDNIVGTDYNETIYMCAYWKPNYDVLGDVNMDDNVTITDVTRLQKYLAGEITFSAYQVKIADVNFDGSATVQDASMIQKYLAGTIDEFGA